MILNVSHYFFFPVKDPAGAKVRLLEKLLGTGIVGTVLIAAEGVNLNLAGEEATLLPRLDAWLRETGCTRLDYKKSYSAERTFKRLKIKVKKEIITMGVENLNVAEQAAPHLSPDEFSRLLESKDDSTLILDTRNDFEVEHGTFEGAVPAGMKSFRDFTQVAERLPKDKKIVMFCTGGVRCEKASAYLKGRGFPEVWQLEGGILRYLERVGWKGFRGECFVFDERECLKDSIA